MEDEDKYHGHEFFLFKFSNMRDCVELKVFEVVGWDKGEPQAGSLFGLTKTSEYCIISVFFMNFYF